MYEYQLDPTPGKQKAARENVSGLLGKCEYGLFMRYCYCFDITFLQVGYDIEVIRGMALFLGKA